MGAQFINRVPPKSTSRKAARRMLIKLIREESQFLSTLSDRRAVVNDVVVVTTCSQFHQRSTRSFYVRKLRAQLFCAYVLGLYFMGARLLA
jgi:hypothetical protein